MYNLIHLAYKIIKQWYVGFFLDDIEDSENKLHRVDHLERKEGSVNNKCWIKPKCSDIQIVKEEQILPVNVCGSWDFLESVQLFQLENVEEVVSVFRSISKEIK